MKKITLLFLFAITITNAQSKKTNTYSDEYIKFSYPKSWKLIKNIEFNESFIGLHPKKETIINKHPAVNFCIFKTPIGNYTSIDEYSTYRLERIMKHTKEVKVKTISSKFGPLKIIIFTRNLPNSIEFKQMEYIFMHKNAVYSFYYEAPLDEFDKFLNTSKGIFSSIELH